MVGLQAAGALGRAAASLARAVAQQYRHVEPDVQQVCSTGCRGAAAATQRTQMRAVRIILLRGEEVPMLLFLPCHCGGVVEVSPHAVSHKWSA